jgi:hypothetical protein
MNNFIKQVIEEKFASKAQQRYFYAQAGKGGKKGKKWSKWAKEFSDKTDYEKIPEKVENEEEEVDEIVDSKGNIARSKKPTDLATKGISDTKTSDEVAQTAYGQMGIHGIGGTHTSLRYWAEGKQPKGDMVEVELDNNLGAEETILKNKTYEEAKRYFIKELGLDEIETEKRLKEMGYDPKLPDDMVNLVENPMKFMEEYIESKLKKKQEDENDVLSKQKGKELDKIIVRQIEALKHSMDSHNISINDLLDYLKKEDE